MNGFSSPPLGAARVLDEGYDRMQFILQASNAPQSFVAGSESIEGDYFSIMDAAPYTFSGPATGDRFWVCINCKAWDPAKAIPMTPGDSRTGKFKGLFVALAGYPNPKNAPANNTSTTVTVEISKGGTLQRLGVGTPTAVATSTGSEVNVNLNQVNGTALSNTNPVNVQLTDGAGHTMPSGDTAARAGFEKITDGTNTLSVSAAGAAKVDGSGVTQPISGTVTSNANINQVNGVAVSATNPLPVELTDGAGHVMPSGDTAARAGFEKITDGTNTLTISVAGAAKVDGSAVTQPVSGTVTANLGTVNGASSFNTAATVSVTTTATQILAANASRRGGYIVNNGATDMYVGNSSVISGAAAGANGGMIVKANGGALSLSYLGGYTGAIFGIVASGTTVAAGYDW